MKQILKYIVGHVRYWGENYVILPLVVVALIASIGLFNFLTGRSPLEDVGAIVGWLIQALGVCVVASLTGLTQYFLYGYRSNITPCKLSDDIYDASITSFLLVLWSVIIFGLIR